ncbi:MAG: ABC transporter substrate-binding protein [Candidatus Latescibacterota bacterium]|nr:MAG: ABC transporter substrate-binding protein [Candidatus Latescibacterota bacterium]
MNLRDVSRTLILLALWMSAAVAIGLAGIQGCTKAGRTGGSDGASAGDAEALYSQVKSEFDAGDYELAGRHSVELLNTHPEYHKADEVLYIAIKSSYESSDFTGAVNLAGRSPEAVESSPYQDEILVVEAGAYKKLGMYYESADALSRLLALPIDPGVRDSCVVELRMLAQDKLGAADLDRLVAAYPSSPLAAEMSFDLAKKEYARGDYDRAYSLLANLLYEFPQHERSREIRYLLQLAANRRDDPNIRVEYIEPNKLGVLLPRTGDFSRFGRYFEEGARLAVEEFNSAGDAQVSLVLGDTRADPVNAVNAARKLVLEEGVLSVLGSVFTMPSIAAATECNARRAPMLSPIVSDRGIGDIGPWVFQTKVPVEVEVTAMARLAVEDLLHSRFAVLAPSSSDKRALTALFIEEVQRLGGTVVAEQYYGSGDTDHRDQLEVIREAAPEALFIPGEPVELMQILPQVRFFDLQVQLLGLSNWNSDKLLRLSTGEIEGAIFPREGYFGKDPTAYQQFADRYRKKHGGSSDDIHPIAIAGFFGMRVLLDAIAGGAVDREQMRELLDKELTADAATRMARASSLPVLKVTSGEAREFTAHKKQR